MQAPRYESQDTKYMRMALKLAQRGIGSVEPNPAVGAVIVKANQVIGRGFHKQFGGPHAELNALEDCKGLRVNPQGAVMYVNLEPCCHQGKTAPCTDTIIAAKLAKVVVATIDPSEHAAGRGVEQMRKAGIEVQIGVCEAEARLLNAPFIKFAATGRCWVVLKWAQSLDGKLAYAGGNKKQWISNEQSRKDTHNLRRRAGAILVGINTVLADDPLLTARPVRSLHRSSTSLPEGPTSNGARPAKEKEATRIVLDSRLRIPPDCRLLTTAKETPVLILTSPQALQANPQTAEKITQTGAEVLAYPNMQGRSNLYFLLDELNKRRIAQLLVEGGPTVITSFLKERLADEIVIYIAPKLLGAEGAAALTKPLAEFIPPLIGAELTQPVGLCYVDARCFGNDVRLTGLTEKAVSELGIARG
jgi:diaminohydroxyphosphoribosylaminopyrimidine deaminase/5-amino-6-(5-phosphoribosylamino)uracil reductase